VKIADIVRHQHEAQTSLFENNVHNIFLCQDTRHVITSPYLALVFVFFFFTRRVSFS